MRNIPAWLIVSIGLLFNITAALVTHFLIEKENNELVNIHMQTSKNENEMGLLWAQIEAVEQKRDTILLMNQQGGIDSDMSVVISNIMYSHLQLRLSSESLNNIHTINSKIDFYQQGIREQIDQLFLDNLSLAEVENMLKGNISLLRNWSLFLQLIGLSLILARDLTRHSNG